MDNTAQAESLNGPHIEVKGLTMAYGSFVIQKDLTFTINRGDIFIIMGASGCGKSTLLRHMVGLKEPADGSVMINGESFWDQDEEGRNRLMRKMGVMFQGGALWSSMTLLENVSLAMGEYTNLSPRDVEELASYKLALVGLKGFENFYPSEISGGMQKRAGLARAMALDPEMLFFDEPSAGLDPISAKLLDDLILELNGSLGATVVVVTHELASIFAIGNNAVFLDPESKTMIAQGRPSDLLESSPDPRVRSFLRRGKDAGGGGAVETAGGAKV